MSRERIMEMHREQMESLQVDVKIDHNEVMKLVIRDLIQKYMSRSCEANKENHAAFERVLVYYLGEDDFKKYVINGSKIQ